MTKDQGPGPKLSAAQSPDLSGVRRMTISDQGPDPVRVYCCFCSKSQLEVRWLIAGTTAFICNECAAACVDIVAELDASQLQQGAHVSAAPPTSEVPSAWRDIEPTADMIAAGHEALHRIGEVDHDRHVLMLGSSVGAARGVFRAMAAVAPATPGAGSGGTGGDDREGDNG